MASVNAPHGLWTAERADEARLWRTVNEAVAAFKDACWRCAVRCPSLLQCRGHTGQASLGCSLLSVTLCKSQALAEQPIFTAGRPAESRIFRGSQGELLSS